MENSNEQGLPPSYGYRSYAELIKQRLIYGRFYAGWSVTQGRYTFSIMMHPRDAEERWRGEPIGYEMTTWRRRGATNPADSWVLRVYLDGTALYRPHILGWLRYPTMRTIKSVIDYFFYVEDEMRERHNRIYVLRRKPLNPQHMAPVSKGFGEFLTSKYNKQEGQK